MYKINPTVFTLFQTVVSFVLKYFGYDCITIENRSPLIRNSIDPFKYVIKATKNGQDIEFSHRFSADENEFSIVPLGGVYISAIFTGSLRTSWELDEDGEMLCMLMEISKQFKYWELITDNIVN